MVNQSNQARINDTQQQVCPCCGRCPLCGQPKPQFVPYNPWYQPTPVPYNPWITPYTTTCGAVGADLTGASSLGGEAYNGMGGIQSAPLQDGIAQFIN